MVVAKTLNGNTQQQYNIWGGSTKNSVGRVMYEVLR